MWGSIFCTLKRNKDFIQLYHDLTLAMFSSLSPAER